MDHKVDILGVPHAFEVIVRVMEWETGEERDDTTTVIALSLVEAMDYMIRLLNDVGYSEKITEREVISIRRLNDPAEGVFLTHKAKNFLIAENDIDLTEALAEAKEEAQNGSV